MPQLAYRRVLLKLSGEALMGDEDYGIDPKVIGRLAREVLRGPILKYHNVLCHQAAAVAGGTTPSFRSSRLSFAWMNFH